MYDPTIRFLSVNAGTDGFNFNVTNAQPLFPVVVAPPPPRTYVPLRPGVEYRPVVTPKQYKKAVKRYRKAIRRATPSVGVMFPGGPVVGVPAQYYYYYDDDDYEEMYEKRYRHDRKAYKHYKKGKKHRNDKHHKHHKHHHDD